MTSLLSAFGLFLSFLFLNVFANSYVFLGSIVFYLILFALFIFKFKYTQNQILTHFFNLLTFLIIFLLIEETVLRWFLTFLLPIEFLFVNFWYKSNLKRSVYIKEKPLRRIMMFILGFDVFAFLSGIFAANNYFPEISFSLLAFIAGIFIAFISHLLWSMYFKHESKKILYWAGLLAVVFFEICFVFYFLPFGFFVSALLISWLWYIVQLYIRFHISHKGIIWKKQRKFLITNLILYILVLLIIRWI